MRVIVHAEDRSGRGDGLYTKPGIDEALDIFFTAGEGLSRDPDGEEPMTRDEAAATFAAEREVTFWNEDGERTTITADPSDASGRKG